MVVVSISLIKGNIVYFNSYGYKCYNYPSTLVLFKVYFNTLPFYYCLIGIELFIYGIFFELKFILIIGKV